MNEIIKYSLRVISILLIISLLLTIGYAISNTSFAEWMGILSRMLFYIVGSILGLVFYWAWNE